MAMNHSERMYIQKISGAITIGIVILNLIFAVVYYFQQSPGIMWVMTNIMGNFIILCVATILFFKRNKITQCIQIAMIAVIATLCILDDFNTMISLLLVTVALILAYCYFNTVRLNIRATLIIVMIYICVAVGASILINKVDYTNAIQNIVAISGLSVVSYVVSRKQLKKHELEVRNISKLCMGSDQYIEAISIIEGYLPETKDVKEALKKLKDREESTKTIQSLIGSIESVINF